MLVEAAKNPLSKADLQTKAVKRRRLDDGSSQVIDSGPTAGDGPEPPMDGVENGDEGEIVRPAMHKQTVFDDFGVSDDDSEDDFEDVDLEADPEESSAHDITNEPLQLDLSRKPGPEITPAAGRRKPATAVERKIRLGVHKWHVLCLLAHVQRRNHWCDDDRVQSILKPLIPRKLVKMLHLDASQPQYQRTHSFNVAIEEISKIWRSEWKITEQGMRRAYWKEDPDDLKNMDDYPDPIDQNDFRNAAEIRSGSRDLAAQLFCSLFRAVAVETRLVCSLQPLPFSGVAKGTTPQKPKPQYILASSFGRQPQLNQNGGKHAPQNPRWRLYDAEPERSTSSPLLKRPSKRIKDSPYPIFWVEVFNEALQKWIPIDPIVRNTINKPKTGFEPPANDSLNNMSYIIAFEDDGSAKDVTRQYAQFYNGKTRKNRIESTTGGEKWWSKTVSFFEKPFPEDRDGIENAELLGREENEQMPKNVQDFKNHPHYALERHLRRKEVIHPRREIGKVSVGLSKNGKLEPVFRRRDVLIVKTADQWYRIGRDVKIGEPPLKRVVPLKRQLTPIGEEGEQEDGALLYAEFQTELYVPPIVVNGKIPKNSYGNLDVFVPSMIPAGGIHVQHPDAAKAAKILGVHYADAVTGFEFKGRQGTAVTNGVVAAAGYEDALVEVLHGLTDERARMLNEKRSSIALQMWKRFLTALRIRERVNAKYGEGGGETGDEEEDMEDESYGDEDKTDEESGGGFSPENTEGPATLPQSLELQALSDGQDVLDFGSTDDIEIPIVIQKSPHKLPAEQQPRSSAAGPPPMKETILAGGFVPEHDIPHDEDEGGGFIVEAPRAGHAAQPPSSSSSMAKEGSPHTSSFASQTMGISPADTSSDAVLDSLTTFPNNQKNHTGRDPPPPPPQPAPPQPAPATKPSPPETEIEAEDAIDSDESLSKGSLLSHDPEDEDAEPEWLAEAMDSD